MYTFEDVIKKLRVWEKNAFQIALNLPDGSLEQEYAIGKAMAFQEAGDLIDAMLRDK